jgi:subtilisin
MGGRSRKVILVVRTRNGVRSLRSGLIACLAVAALAVCAAAAGAATTSRYIVILKAGTDPSSLAKAQGVQPVLTYVSALDGYTANLTDAQVKKIATNASVVSITPDRTISLSIPDLGSNDGVQAVDNAIRRVGADRSPTAKIDGRDDKPDVDVAVIDSGLDNGHTDLRISGGVNCSSGQGKWDQLGHGSWVGGAAAAIDNGKGVVGTAPGARLWSVRVIDANNEGELSNVLCGVDWVTANASTIEVATMALEDFGTDDGNCGHTNGDLLHQAICRSVSAGVVYVVAAGNDGADVSGFIPGAYREAVTVSTLSDTDGRPGGLGPTSCFGDQDDALASFSNYGAAIDLTAPGECVWTTGLNGGYNRATSNGISVGLVAGAAADYRLRHPTASPQAVRDALVASGESTSLLQDPDGVHEPVLNMAGL